MQKKKKRKQQELAPVLHVLEEVLRLDVVAQRIGVCDQQDESGSMDGQGASNIAAPVTRTRNRVITIHVQHRFYYTHSHPLAHPAPRQLDTATVSLMALPSNLYTVLTSNRVCCTMQRSPLQSVEAYSSQPNSHGQCVSQRVVVVGLGR